MSDTTVWGTIDGTEITFPMEVPEFNGITVLYSVPSDAAQALLPGDGFEVLETAPGVAQLIIAAVDYAQNPWGDYNEINLGFLVRPTGAPDDVMGSFVFRMPVNQAFTCEAGNRVMGFPKTVETIDVAYTADKVSFSLVSDGALALSLEFPRVPSSAPASRTTSVSYSYLDGRPYGTQLDMELGTGLVDPADIVLRLGSGIFADELRTLGLPKAADLALWGEGLSATFYLGQPVTT